MTSLTEIIHGAKLNGNTTQAAARKALARARREADEELAERAEQLLLDWFHDQLSQLRHSRNAEDRRVARRKRFEEGQTITILDLMDRLYVVSTINKRLGAMTHEDRQQVLDEMELDIDTRTREREFLAKVDKRAGEQTVEEALTPEELDELYREEFESETDN